MKCKNLFKLFTLFFILIIFAIPAFSQADEFASILSEIEIEQSGTNSYNLNLVFDKDYAGNALMQKNKNNSYYVFIPYAEMNNKNIKIIYKNKYDKSNIKVTPEQREFIKDGIESTYVKLDVDTSNNYNLKLYTKTKEIKNSVFSFSFFKSYMLIICLIMALLIYVTVKVIKSAENKNKNSYTFFPSVKNSVLKSFDIEKEERENEKISNNLNINDTLKSADNDIFSCFEINTSDIINNESIIEYQSPLKQTALIKNKRFEKSKQTNPIDKKYKDEDSSIMIPIAEDVLNKREDEYFQNEGILSKLEITPTKGFYLKSLNNQFSLFGYAGKKSFLLKTFSDLTKINLQARFYDTQHDSDLYIVRLDSYKAMVEISDNGIKELAAL